MVSRTSNSTRERAREHSGRPRMASRRRHGESRPRAVGALPTADRARRLRQNPKARAPADPRPSRAIVDECTSRTRAISRRAKKSLHRLPNAHDRPVCEQGAHTESHRCSRRRANTTADRDSRTRSRLRRGRPRGERFPLRSRWSEWRRSVAIIFSHHKSPPTSARPLRG
jgi:hypothetical protein